MEMKELLELELSKESFFDTSYIQSRLKREGEDKIHMSPIAIKDDGIRFVFIALFHDAKIIDIIDTEKYGKPCIVMRVDLKDTTTEFKKGYGKFDLYFIDAEYADAPVRSKDLHIESLDCAQGPQNLMVDMELCYFTGSQAHACDCNIRCNDIEVKPITDGRSL